VFIFKGKTKGLIRSRGEGIIIIIIKKKVIFRSEKHIKSEGVYN
jgi:hypothetical protein